MSKIRVFFRNAKGSSNHTLGEDMSRPSNLPTDVETDAPPLNQQRRNVSAMANINVRGKDIAPRFNPLEIFKDEKKRLDTFNTWSASAPVKKEDLAKDGFIYLKIDDRTQCVFCRGVLSDWDIGDVVRDEHRRYCPECPFAFGYECGNIPLPGSQRTEVRVPVQAQNNFQHTIHIVPHGGENGGRSVQESGSRPENRFDAQSALPTLPNPSIQQTESTTPTAAPKYPAWDSEQLRLKSYRGWPTQLKQVPRDLANAGLVYLGQGDKCKCFWCGGELYEWEEEDQPWEEHAKWFPYCNFVKNDRGEAYIKYVQDKQNGIITEYPRDVFSLPHVLAVLREGYSQDEVQEALGRFGQALVDARTIKDAIEQTRRERREFLARNNAQNQSNRGIDIVPITLPQDDDVTMEEAPRASTPQQETTSSSGNDDTRVKRLASPSTTATKLQTQTSRGATSIAASHSSSEDVESIKLENMSLKDKTLCKICMDNPLEIVFRPCGHLSTCEHCAKNLRECPICRQTIKEKVKTYMA